MAPPPEVPGVSRRTLLSGACKVAGPAIVTLYSGAALARSSNLIGANPNQGAEQNKYRCLDTRSVDGVVKPNVYDLGKNPMGRVTRISSTRQYYRADSQGNRTSQQVAGNKMCADGGVYYRKDSNTSYTKVQVHKGVLVSATALASFANDITYHDV